MFRENCCLLGRILKTHGVNGNLFLACNYSLPENFKLTESVFFDIDGILVPFFIDDWSFIDDQLLLLKIEDYDSPETANAFVGCDVWVKKEILAGLEEDVALEALVGYTVYDEEKHCLGKIVAIHEIPGNLLFEIDYNGKEVLIPANHDTIKKIDSRSKKLRMVIPDGLTDL